MPLQSASVASSLALLLALPALVLGDDPQHMEITWPVPQIIEPTLEETQDVATKYQTAPLKGGPVFPCYYIPIPDNVKRIPFPIEGAHLQLNRTTGPWSEYNKRETPGDWLFNSYIGQFSKKFNNTADTYSRVSPEWYWSGNEWKEGAFCADPLPIISSVQEEPLLNDGFYEFDVSRDELEGLEATLAIEAVHFMPSSSRKPTDSIVNHCIYIRFTSDPVDTGPCGSGSDSNLGSGSGSPSGSASGSATSSPSPSGTAAVITITGEAVPSATSQPTVVITPDRSSGSGSSAKKIGIIAGSVSGVATVIIVIAVLLLLKRRRGRVADSPLEYNDGLADFNKDIKKNFKEKAFKKKNVKEKDGASIHSDVGSSASVLTEPLPVYEPRQRDQELR